MIAVFLDLSSDRNAVGLASERERGQNHQELKLSEIDFLWHNHLRYGRNRALSTGVERCNGFS